MADGRMSRGSELYLKILGSIWSGYGAWCFFYPIETVEKFFGLKVGPDSHWGVKPEIQAMYGGLQFAVGANGLYAAFAEKDNLQGTIATLRSFALAMGCLGMFRIAAVLKAGKSTLPALSPADNLRVLSEGLSALLPEYYNGNATWIFELPGALAAYLLMKSEQKRLQKSD